MCFMMVYKNERVKHLYFAATILAQSHPYSILNEVDYQKKTTSTHD